MLFVKQWPPKWAFGGLYRVGGIWEGGFMYIGSVQRNGAVNFRSQSVSYQTSLRKGNESIITCIMATVAFLLEKLLLTKNTF